ncbi:MAG: glycosyltransferase family 4 protein [Chloroflexi bacterium]|nr:glycosyltransferase family 4 protein [Chloroflexota bacterium]
MKKQIAVVVQRYGVEVNGGAETAARNIAERLVPEADVHVITTCALDYTTWENRYPPGESQSNGVHIHRFPVDAPRNWRKSQKFTGHFLLRERTLDEEINWIRQEGPFSTPLLQFIKRSEARFDVFIFFTYLYATTFFGLPLVAEKSILVTAAHDEPFLYMDAYRALLQMPRHIIYLTQAEKDLVVSTAQNNHIPSNVLAIGLDAPTDVSAERFRQKYNIHGDFLLYSGRISEAKNVPELVDYFHRFQAAYDKPLQLVLMGKSHIPLPERPDIVPLGFVSEQDKYDGLQAATVFIMPSLFESLSIVILEAWLMGTPVLVNGRCQVLKHQCRQSNGGLYYISYDEFKTELSLLLASPRLRQQLGQQGRKFTSKNYDWETAIAQYHSLFEKTIS